MASEFAADNAGPTVTPPNTSNDRDQTNGPPSDGDEYGSGYESGDTEDDDREQNHADDVAPDTDANNSSVEEIPPVMVKLQE